MDTPYRLHTDVAASRITLPGLLQPLAPPQVLFGRDMLLQEIGQRLQQRGVVALEGMAGIGKSAVLAQAVHLYSQRTCWIEKLPGLCDTGSDLCWQLAQPLAHFAPHVLDDLYASFQSELPFPLVLQLQMVLDSYATLTSPVLVCIDGLDQHLDPTLESVLITLTEHVERERSDRKLFVALSGRSLPYRMRRYALPPLEGLMPEQIALWAKNADVPLTDAQSYELYRETAGLPQVIEIIFHLMAQRDDEISVADLMQSRSIDRFLWSVIGRLPVAERTLLTRLTGSTDTTSFSLEEHEVLAQLADKHLLAISQDQVIKLHPLVRRFFLRLT
jgi:hypothetical protein